MSQPASREMSLTIAPSDINTQRHFWNAFGHMETETSACWIVRLMQEKGGWVPFTHAELIAFYTAPGRRPVGESFHFNGLIQSGYILQAGDVYQVTPVFVAKCYSSSPVKSKTA